MKGDQEGAIVAFRKVPEGSPSFAPAQNDLGVALHTKGDLDGAIAAYRKAVEREPKWSLAHVGLAQALVDEGDFAAAIVAYQHAAELASLPFTIGPDRASGLTVSPGEIDVIVSPAYHMVLNNFAWLLATCREAKFRNAAKAVELAKKATEQAPQEGGHWNTLGVAHYRAGAWKPAVAAFGKSMELRAGGDAFDWLFLAMAHGKLGNRDDARKRYDQAVQWLEKNGPMLAKSPREADELRRFRAEAEEVLGLKKK
jgi:superkiller protein 3